MEVDKNKTTDDQEFWHELEILDKQHWVSEAFKGKGDIEFKGTFRVAGEWEGSLVGYEGDSQLHLLKGGVLKGTIIAQKVHVEGRCVCDSIQCDFLQVREGAFLSGAVKAKKLVIEPGAKIEANFESVNQ